MTFVILFLILIGLVLVLSGIENVSITQYVQGWISGNKTA